MDLIEGAADAAAYTGLTRRQIYRLAEDGHLPLIRKGRQLFFRKSELDEAFRGFGQVRSQNVGDRP